MTHIPGDAELLAKLRASVVHYKGDTLKTGMKMCRRHFVEQDVGRHRRRKDETHFDFWNDPVRGVNWDFLGRAFVSATPRASRSSSVKRRPSVSQSPVKRGGANSLQTPPQDQRSRGRSGRPTSPASFDSKRTPSKRLRRQSLILATAAGSEMDAMQTADLVDDLEEKLEAMALKVKNLENILADRDRGFLTFTELDRVDGFHEVCKVSKETILRYERMLREPFMTASTARGMGVGAVVGNYSLIDYVVWTFAFSASFARFSVMKSMLPGVQRLQIKRKVEWVCETLSAMMRPLVLLGNRGYPCAIPPVLTISSAHIRLKTQLVGRRPRISLTC